MKIITSTKPKGATSYKETAFGIIPRSKLIRLEIEGTKKGLEFVSNLTVKNPRVQITPELILKLHKASFGWIFPNWAGKYRKIRVEFSDKEAVLPHQIPELVVNLCADLQERLGYLVPNQENFIEKVVGLLAWFQHRLVWIHPFQDYNGRVARMMYAADEGYYEKLESLISQALNESLSKSNRQ